MKLKFKKKLANIIPTCPSSFFLHAQLVIKLRISSYSVKKICAHHFSTPHRVSDALCSAAVITPIVYLDKSNAERRSRICASALENLKRKILSSKNESSSELKSSEYSELMKAVKQKMKSNEKRDKKLSLSTLGKSYTTIAKREGFNF
jgi:hypothetical protein